MFACVPVLLLLSTWLAKSEQFCWATPSQGPSGSCQCIAVYSGNEEIECCCSGPELIDIPSTLQNPTTLILENAGIEVLKRNSLLLFSKTLEGLTMRNLESFYYFEPGVFSNLTKLQEIYIHGAPKLLKIQPEVFNAFLPRLRYLRIVHTGLEEMPNLNNLYTEFLMHTIDLEHNHIRKINSRQISKIRAEELLLNYNNLVSVDEEAFHGSQIAKLSLKGNVELKHLHHKAFAGLQSLRYIIPLQQFCTLVSVGSITTLTLHFNGPRSFECPSFQDLSSTAITFLPVEGLSEIDIIKLQDTKSLTVFPSVYNFKYIREAFLTYPYHCCAFKHPDTHDPWEFERHQRFQEKCKGKNTSVTFVLKDQEGTSFNIVPFLPFNVSVELDNEDSETWGEEGIFHGAPIPNNNGNYPTTHATCGNIYRNYHEVKCEPAPDAFNPCEDLMGNWVLRVSVWFISLSAIIGNLFVVIVIATSHFRITVSKFLMCNLAIADLSIGVHLALIAIEDACSIKVYFNYAINWQEGNGCSVAGFLTIFGNILSVYTLAVITIERWYTITMALQLDKRLKLRTAVRVMVAGWICALTMATLPLLGISSYSKTSICLPLENNGRAAAIYLSSLLAFNAITFGLVCICYGSMYRSITEGGINCSVTSVRCDLTVAKKMALLIFTDFACWAPIAFFGMTALMGYPLITVTQTKILLVFFYPLNSCANPCLYALLTQQYRRDFFILMGRYGLCKDRAERHRGAIGGKPLPYCTAPQYRRTCSDAAKAGSRSSPLTTIVSIEMATTRNSSHIRSKQESLDPVPEYSLNLINKCSNGRHVDQNNSKNVVTTENL